MRRSSRTSLPGVGERYFLLFNVSSVVNVPQAYVMLETSQLDSYAYQFNKPTFISLDPTATPDNIVVKGMRIGLNGAEAAVGQAYAPLNTTVTAANYQVGTGQLLSQGRHRDRTCEGADRRSVLPHLRAARLRHSRRG